MKRQIEYGQWIEVDTTHGITFIPGDMGWAGITFYPEVIK